MSLSQNGRGPHAHTSPGGQNGRGVGPALTRDVPDRTAIGRVGAPPVAVRSETYASYLQLDRILTAQSPLTESADTLVRRSERFFIIVHQCVELWMKQVLTDIGAAVAGLAEWPDPSAGPRTVSYLHRVAEGLRIIEHHMRTLASELSREDFLVFRERLNGMSGAESRQFALLRHQLGLVSSTPAPLYEAFSALVIDSGLDVASVCRRPETGALHHVARSLLDVARAYSEMLASHRTMAEEMIGTAAGTGGTAGVAYLDRALTLRAFPELWAAMEVTVEDAS